MGVKSGSRGLKAIVGIRVYDFCCYYVTYIIDQKNPIIQWFYFFVAGGGFIVYVKQGMMNYLPGPFLDTWHAYTGSTLMFICYYSFYRACTDDPGVIRTPQ